MHSSRLLWLTVAVVLVVPMPAEATGSAWPMFRGNPRHTGRTPHTGPAEPTVSWVLTANDAITSSPSLGSDGTIYVGAGGYFGSVSDTSFYAINPDGTLKWRYPTEQGVFSSPAIGPDGTIYFGSLDYHLYAVEDSITYGATRWKTNIGHRIYSSPVIGPDGTIYVGGLNFKLFALNSQGWIMWDYRTLWCVFSSPAIGPDGVIYVGSKDEHLYSFDDLGTEGAVRWAHATGEFYDGHLVDSSPAIGEDGTLYVGTDPYGAFGQTPVPVDTVFFAVNPDGSRKWSFVMEDGAESSPAIGPDGTIYVGSYDGNLYAIRDEGDAGILEWAFPTGGAIDASPTVDAFGTIYVGSRDSTLYAINPDGSLRWSLPTGGGIESSATIDDTGMLYVGTFAGDVYAIGTSGPDVGVASIAIPAEVGVDSVYTVGATVGNYRSGSQSFEVSCTIDAAGQPVYGDTLLVSDLAELTSAMVTFAPWLVGPDPGIVYTISVAISLAADNNAYNDDLSVQVTAVSGTVGVADVVAGAPRRPTVDLCAPNPLRVASVIHFSIPRSSLEDGASQIPVSVRIYDLAGRVVRSLVHEPRPAGAYREVWDGRDDRGRRVSSGIHFCRLQAGLHVDEQKIVVLR